MYPLLIKFKCMVTKLFVSPGEPGVIITYGNPAHPRCGKNPHELESLRFRAVKGSPAIQRKEMANFGTGNGGILLFSPPFASEKGGGSLRGFVKQRLFDFYCHRLSTKGVASVVTIQKIKIKTPIENHRNENIMMNCTLNNPLEPVPPSIEGGMRGCNASIAAIDRKIKSIMNLERGFAFVETTRWVVSNYNSPQIMRRPTFTFGKAWQVVSTGQGLVFMAEIKQTPFAFDLPVAGFDLASPNLNTLLIIVNTLKLQYI
jgi:hypothetical protein